MLRPVSSPQGGYRGLFLLTIVVLFTQLNLTALLPSHQAEASRCGEAQKLYLPIVHAMSEPNLTERLESIIRKDAAFPYDGLITQVFATTVNVMPVGSRTVLRDVALPAHISSDTIQIGYAVRLDQTAAKPTVLAIFEQFADPEMFNYAGLGVKVPANPSVTVKATKTGWLVSWGAISEATKYILYKNDTPDGDSPEEVIQLGGSTLSYTVGFEDPFIYYAVKACSGYLESDVSLWMTDMTPPAAPAWKAHAYQTGGHYLEWTHGTPADVKEFIIYGNTSASDVGAVEITRTANLNTVVAYVDGQDYFGVQAVDWSGVNKSALVWSVKYGPTPASAPTLTAIIAEFGGFTLSWTAVSLAATYEVESATDSNGTGATSVWTGATLTTPVIKVTGISWFRVRTIGHDGSVGPWSAWTTDTNPPPQPQMLVVDGQGQVALTLTASDQSAKSIGFSHYKVEMADNGAGLNATILDAHALASAFPMVLFQAEGVSKYFRLTPYDWVLGVSRSASESPTYQDKFDGYGGLVSSPLESLYWLRVTEFSYLESWAAELYTSYDSTHGVDGHGGMRIAPGGITGWIAKEVSLDFSQEGRFTDDDYVSIALFVSGNPANLNTVEIDFASDSGFQHNYGKNMASGLATGWNFVKVKKSEFGVLGSPDWSSIVRIRALVTLKNPDATYVTFDDWRVVKADPDDPTTSNDTGSAWDYAASTGTDKGEWHIYEGQRDSEPGKPFSYGQIKHVASPTQWYASYKPTLNIVTGTIQTGVFHRENGKSGLAFFVKDTAPDQWTMYAVEADNVADTVKLVKWVDGRRTELGSANFAFISAAGGGYGQTVWIGADFSQYDSDSGRIKVYASINEGNLIQAGNLKISLQDTEVGSGGTMALLSNQLNVRFVNLTAGSPAHADVADVAKALDGPIIIGEQKRLVYDATTNRWAWTDDGGTTLIPLNAAHAEYANEAAGAAYAYDAGDASNLGGIAAANYLQRVSAARPGVTRLYRRDSDQGHNIQVTWDGTRWLLQGYNGDTYHAPARVAYADNAGALGATVALR
jgi:hypothetical protein